MSTEGFWSFEFLSFKQSQIRKILPDSLRNRLSPPRIWHGRVSRFEYCQTILKFWVWSMARSVRCFRIPCKTDLVHSRVSQFWVSQTERFWSFEFLSFKRNQICRMFPNFLQNWPSAQSDQSIWLLLTERFWSFEFLSMKRSRSVRCFRIPRETGFRRSQVSQLEHCLQKNFEVFSFWVSNSAKFVRYFLIPCKTGLRLFACGTVRSVNLSIAYRTILKFWVFEYPPEPDP